MQGARTPWTQVIRQHLSMVWLQQASEGQTSDGTADTAIPLKERSATQSEAKPPGLAGHCWHLSHTCCTGWHGSAWQALNKYNKIRLGEIRPVSLPCGPNTLEWWTAPIGPHQ